MTEGFPKRLRIRRRREYIRVQRSGRRIGTPSFTVYARPNRGRATRLGVTTSRKVGNAVRRNRWKRLLREAFRRNAPSRPKGFDVVFVVRADRPAPTFAQVTQELLSVLSTLNAPQPRSGPAAPRRPQRKRRPQ
ncbi:ribonuclease P protein component [Myxococcota bacterium]|nr:ribonuclease P protein component [Myxococcota bacterium]MBU1431501.1 ribonuclease P protein component [Myxococcota bacterium]MBU1898154.1 ribonuclease P protein component [Myxococcota bacterium]